MNKFSVNDKKIMEFLHENFQSDFLDKIMPKISSMANIGLIWILIACLMLISHKYKNVGKVLVKALLISAVVCNMILKPLVGRNRPFEVSPDLEARIIKEPTDPGFPSGHTMASFVAAMVIFCASPVLGVLAFILAFMIGLSRLYLLVHYPTDVFMGSFLGGIIGAFSVFKFGGKG